MRLVRFSIENYRSIVKAADIRIEGLQAFVGENNVGKSNILTAVRCFLEVGSAGIEPSDFNEQGKPVVLEAEFSGLSKPERKRLRSYLIGDRLIIQKQIRITQDEKSGKKKVGAEYHGYQAEPTAWFLSLEKVEAKEGKPNWKRIAEDHGLLAHAQTPDGKVTKTSYGRGLEIFLAQHDDVEYDSPELGKTKALGPSAESPERASRLFSTPCHHRLLRRDRSPLVINGVSAAYGASVRQDRASRPPIQRDRGGTRRPSPASKPPDHN